MLAESYERIHRSNLVGMGVIPLEYLPGNNAESLGLTGHERYTITIPEHLTPRMILDMKVHSTLTHLTIMFMFCGISLSPSCVSVITFPVWTEGILFLEMIFRKFNCDTLCCFFLLSQLNTGKTFQVRMRFDTDVELAYFHHGGILNYMIRKMSEN